MKLSKTQKPARTSWTRRHLLGGLMALPALFALSNSALAELKQGA